MLRLPIFPIFVAVILTPVIVCGCSGGGMNPVTPDNEQLSTIPKTGGTSNRVLWGMWEIHYDLEQMTFDVTPLRNVQPHFNITNMLLPPNCEDCIKITVNSFDPATRILDAYVTLRNPYKITGYDVRGILYTDEAGHELRNADDWTGLFDILGGELINPFKAFAKEVPKRLFASYAFHKENYRVYIPEPPDIAGITFAVTASWPGNAKEPYEIENFHQTELTPEVGSIATVSVEVRDWQDDVNKVTLVAPLITGEQFTQLEHQEGDLWTAEIANSMGIPLGSYKTRIIATSSGSSELALFDFVTIEVTGVPDDPVEVTPPWLNFSPEDILVDSNYAYVAGSVNGLHIFNVADPSNPTWVHHINLPGSLAYEVVVEGNYAYVADGDGGLQIIDIQVPESAYVVKEVVDPDNYFSAVDVENGYGYVITSSFSDILHIIDINPLESANIVHTIEFPEGISSVTVDGKYAYLGIQSGGGLYIVDIGTPESAELVKTVFIGDKLTNEVIVNGGYAYLPGGWIDGWMNAGYIDIVDISPVETASFIKSIDAGTPCYDIGISGDYAYACCDRLLIVDISQPESAYIAYTLSTPKGLNGIHVSMETAYLVDLCTGLYVVDIKQPESAYIMGTVPTAGCATDVDVHNGIAYVGSDSLQVIQVEPPGGAFISNTINMPEPVSYVVVDENYAYAAGGTDFYIFDLSSPSEPSLLTTISNLKYPRDIAIADDYAYITNPASGLQIIDIDPPESAYVVKVVELADNGADDVTVEGTYAYVTDNISQHIVDISPPEEAHIVNSTEVPGSWALAHGIEVNESYSYVLSSKWVFPDIYSKLHIMDIDPPEDTYIVKSVKFLSNIITKDLVLMENYAYVVGVYGLEIVDINPIDTSYILSQIELPGDGEDVCLSGNYAYVADDIGGLRIIKLW